jgi:uncharacterized protein (DUF1800 family)
MSDQTKPTSAGQAWAPYVPDEKAPWNLRRVVHLHRRAGFAATWGEIQRDLRDGPKDCIDRLLTGKARRDGVAKDFEARAGMLADTVTAHDSERLKAWWIYRMLFGPDPLTERLALMWHNHFATSVVKVRDTALMRRQNETFRALARAPFCKLLHHAVHDPALLIWLDAPANRKGHPNENLARELMELFTIGIGHYTETDVKEAARALTGWTIADGKFRDDPERHDEGEKIILGRKGRLKGDDLVGLLLEQPTTALRLAWRLCAEFMGEGAIDADATTALAAGLRDHDLDVGWAVETLLRSRAFFADANLGNRVLGPVEYVVGAARALERFDPAPSTMVLADWCARLGQDLFQPPNVGGWPGGRQWISAKAMIGRANYAASLLNGTSARDPEPFDPLALAKRHGRGSDLADVIAFHGELLFGSVPAESLRKRLNVSLGANATTLPDTARRAIILLLASPEAQLA